MAKKKAMLYNNFTLKFMLNRKRDQVMWSIKEFQTRIHQFGRYI